MRNSQRLMALGVFGVFAVVIGSGLMVARPAQPALPPPSLLPVAHAAPAEVGFADTLHAGETLSELLARAELAEGEARELVGELRHYQNPRQLQPGSVLSYRKSVESGSVRGVDLKLDADRTLSLQREGDHWTGSIAEVPVHVDTVVLSGEVHSSLYEAVLNAQGSDLPTGEREQIVDVVADRVFAWVIDFSRDVREGDRFRVLYERQVRPDGSARSGRVLAVQFNLNSRDYQAYLFRAPNGTEDYYDRDGGSLRRAFLRAPLAFRRISSVFSRSRYHPLLKTTRPHYGIDYAAASGTPVHAVGDGTVVRAGRAGGYGNLVEIRHKHGYSTRYGHLRAFARGVHAGARVKQGDLIGYVGMTGLATGPHLHYEFREDGRPVNPNGVKFITGDPVAKRYRDDFRARMHEEVLALDRAASPVLLADARAAAAAPSGE